MALNLSVMDFFRKLTKYGRGAYIGLIDIITTSAKLRSKLVGLGKKRLPLRQEFLLESWEKITIKTSQHDDGHCSPLSVWTMRQHWPADVRQNGVIQFTLTKPAPPIPSAPVNIMK